MARKKTAGSASPDLTYIPESLRRLAVPLDQLHEDPANARKHDEADIAATADSLAKFGQLKTLTVHRDGRILKGNGTYLAAKRLGWTHLAVVWSDEPELRAAAYAIADNKSGESSRFDPLKVDSLLAEIGDDALPASLFDGLAELTAELTAEAATTPDPSPSPAPRGSSPCNVLIACDSKRHQTRLLKRFRESGRTVTPVSADV